MDNRLKLFSIILVLLLSSCSSDDDRAPVVVDPEIENTSFSKITLGDQDTPFVNAEGEAFFSWGFNYTNAQIIGFIEDNWDQESTWEIIAEDFEEMKGYGANIIRIHLQFNKFMMDANTPNQIALERLQRLVKIAEDKKLYLDVTGLAAYRISDSPEWYDSLSDADRWEAHAVFWKNIAATIGNSNAVFAYNLMNEPVVAVECAGVSDCDWWPGPGFGGFNFVQNIARNPDLDYAATMKDWIGELTEAIRSEDQTTMITVGFLALGSVTRFEEDLDYLSIHVYPKSEELQLAVDKVLNNQSGSPLILEEASNLRCSIEEFERFLKQIDGHYNGLMGHYFGTTLEELEGGNTYADASREDFINFFVANNPN